MFRLSCDEQDGGERRKARGSSERWMDLIELIGVIVWWSNLSRETVRVGIARDGC